MLKEKIDQTISKVFQETWLEYLHYEDEGDLDTYQAYDYCWERAKEKVADNIDGYDLISTHKSNKNYDEMMDILYGYIINLKS